MDKHSYSSIDPKSGRRIGRGWLEASTQALRNRLVAAKGDYSGKNSRAGVFRHYVEFIRRTIGDEWICSYHVGDVRGREKDSRYGILFWMPQNDNGQASLYIALVDVNARHYLDKKSIVGPIVLAEVTDHAVTRTICRMAKQDDISYTQMCDEFRVAVEQLLPLLFARIQAVNEKKNIDCPDLIVPTPSGAVTVRVVDSPGAGKNARRRILFTTWLSDETMRSAAQLQAIESARAKGSVLLDDGRMARRCTGFCVNGFSLYSGSIRSSN